MTQIKYQERLLIVFEKKKKIRYTLIIHLKQINKNSLINPLENAAVNIVLNLTLVLPLDIERKVTSSMSLFI